MGRGKVGQMTVIHRAIDRVLLERVLGCCGVKVLRPKSPPAREVYLMMKGRLWVLPSSTFALGATADRMPQVTSSPQRCRPIVC